MSLNDGAAADQKSAVAPSSYSHLTLRRITALSVGVGLLLICVLGDILTGPALLSVADTVAALFGLEAASSMTTVIVWDIRLPMTLMALTVGAALAVAGVIMQTILGNPLASPYTLGFFRRCRVWRGCGTAHRYRAALPAMAHRACRGLCRNTGVSRLGLRPFTRSWHDT